MTTRATNDGGLGKPPPQHSGARAVQFTYTNHDDKVAIRTVVPIRWWFGVSEWYPGEHWFLNAYDLDRRAYRDFAQTRIEGWIDRPLPEQLDEVFRHRFLIATRHADLKD